MKIVYLIIASNLPENLLDESSQRATWAHEQPASVLWLRGGKNEFYNAADRTLFVEIQENYQNILAKTVKGALWCLENLEFEFLIRANVSSYFVPTRVESYLSGFLVRGNERFFGGFIENERGVGKANLESVFINGGSMFMNRTAVEDLVKVDISKWQNCPDDISISKHLIGGGVVPTPIPRGNLCITGIFTNRIYYRLKSSNNSIMASGRMYRVHNVVLAKNTRAKAVALFSLYVFEFCHFKKNFINFRYYFLGIYSLFNSLRMGLRLKARDA